MDRNGCYTDRGAKGETKVSLSGIADNSVIYFTTRVFPSFLRGRDTAGLGLWLGAVIGILQFVFFAALC